MRLLLRNRSYRGYDTHFVVREDQLRSIIAVNTRIPSARNAQVLRFRPVLADEADKVLPHIRLGGALPELHLPLPGTEPRAFIIVCTTVPEDRYVDMDLGISAQSMLLRAAEIGLNSAASRCSSWPSARGPSASSSWRSAPTRAGPTTAATGCTMCPSCVSTTC